METMMLALANILNTKMILKKNKIINKIRKTMKIKIINLKLSIHHLLAKLVFLTFQKIFNLLVFQQIQNFRKITALIYWAKRRIKVITLVILKMFQLSLKMNIRINHKFKVQFLKIVVLRILFNQY